MSAAGRHRAEPRERLVAGFVAAVGCSVFAIAARLDPYDAGIPRTHETHRQLGLPPCLMLSMTGFPCASCGMTTSISLLAHGDPIASWRANWAGTLIAGAGVLATGWLVLLTCGVPHRPIAGIEPTILTLAIASATVTFVRYFGLVAATFIARGP